MLLDKLDTVLRAQPWLTLYDYNDLSTRLLEESGNDLFVAFNRKSSKFEIHSVWSFFRDPQRISKNATLGKPWLNAWLIRDFRTVDNLQVAVEKEHDRESLNNLLDQHEERMSGKFIQAGMSRLKDILGRHL